MKSNKFVIPALIGAGIVFLIAKRMNLTSLIARFEGLELRAYQDQAGVWTIGYGSTFNPFTNRKVQQGDTITKEEALRWLEEHIKFFRGNVVRLLKIPQSQNQISALTSLAYNIGIGAFQRSTLLRLLNSGAPAAQVADQFLRWNRIKGEISRGLTNRRQLEKDLYLS